MVVFFYFLRKVVVEKFNVENYWKKKGLVMVFLKYFVGFGLCVVGQVVVLVYIYFDGFVLVIYGGIEMGQGVYIKMIQVVSCELGMLVLNVYLCGISIEIVFNVNVFGGFVVVGFNGLVVKDVC